MGGPNAQLNLIRVGGCGGGSYLPGVEPGVGLERIVAGLGDRGGGGGGTRGGKLGELK